MELSGQTIKSDLMEHLKMKNAVYETEIAYLMNRISQQSEDIRRHDEQIAYLMNRITQLMEENGSHIGKLLCGQNETPKVKLEYFSEQQTRKPYLKTLPPCTSKTHFGYYGTLYYSILHYTSGNSNLTVRVFL